MIKKFKKLWFKWQLRRGLLLLWKIDNYMKVRKWPAYKRKQFWHDFIKSPKSRSEIFGWALKELQ